MLTDIITEITTELTIPKLIVGLIAYGTIHGAYRILSHLEKRVIDEAAGIIKHRHNTSKGRPVAPQGWDLQL